MNWVRKYTENKSGQVAVVTAIMALPMIIGVSAAIEHMVSVDKVTNLQSALDAAALGAANPGNLTITEREAFALELFKLNFSEENGTAVQVTATDNRVDIEASHTRKSYFGSILGKDDLVVGKSASAIRTTEDIICIMALNPKASGALTIDKKAVINAPACSIQVNSAANDALTVTAARAPTAKSICVNGGAKGNAIKGLKKGCSVLDDPYASISVPSYGGCDFGPIQLFNLGSYQEVMEVGTSGETLKPGVYCNGMHIYDSDVTLAPGVYVIKDGPLSIGHNARVRGEGVTFIFTGDGSYLYTYENVQLDLTAPKDGDYAGLIFLQDKSQSAGETSIIKGGVDMRLVGTSYFPTQKLFIGGIGEMGASSPAMAFIADTITFTSEIDDVISSSESEFLYFKSMLETVVRFAGENQLTSYSTSEVKRAAGSADGAGYFTTSIETNHQEAGLPPILPRSDAGVKLISPGQ